MHFGHEKPLKIMASTWNFALNRSTRFEEQGLSPAILPSLFWGDGQVVYAALASFGGIYVSVLHSFICRLANCYLMFSWKSRLYTDNNLIERRCLRRFVPEEWVKQGVSLLAYFHHSCILHYLGHSSLPIVATTLAGVRQNFNQETKIWFLPYRATWFTVRSSLIDFLSSILSPGT